MHRRELLVLLADAAVAALVQSPSASASPDPPPDAVTTIRSATETFRSIATAEQHGYALLTDTKKTACIDMPGIGGMGVHWANGTLVADKQIDLTRPEAPVYVLPHDGTLQLAAAEYVVLKTDWDAAHPQPPQMFGHTFDLTAAPNRFGLPAHYSLHAWVWEHNPVGRFAPFNPAVTCPPA